jgi:uncharacterized protein YbcC (UPF0753/DUF2309 family)
VTTTSHHHDASASIAAAVDAACDRIAPTWPLDRFIAVNPYWGWRGWSAPDAAAALGALAGTAMTMPRSWFREEWTAGRLTSEHLSSAAIAVGDPDLAAAALALLERRSDHIQPVISRMALATDLRDRDAAPLPGRTWADLVTHQIGQHCAAHFDRWQGSWHPDRSVDLFAGWRRQLSASHSVKWQRGASWARAQISTLPAESDAAIGMMLHSLMIPEEGHEAYLTALLLSVNGWAAWCAYRRWQARLEGGDDNEIVGLLAIRLAWDWLLRNDANPIADDDRWHAWAGSWATAHDVAAAVAHEQRVDWLLQTALEWTFQDTIISALPGADTAPDEVPAAQAVFCIDVRSEVFRRALEGATPEVHTRGFAGFFGLPISYTPVGSALTRPQLPGLLAPALHVSETTTDKGDLDAIIDERSATLSDRQRWSNFRRSPSSVFSFVESMGLMYGPKLFHDSQAHTDTPPRWENDGLTAGSHTGLRPRLAMVDDDPAAAAAVAHRVLRGMGLIDGFAPLVLLCGHGAQTANNPHAAGLDCGACGGQTGEVNARVLADLLNSVAVRAHLARLGITVPSTTWFVPALHNTTTDEVHLFDTELVPADKHGDVAQLQQWLSTAGALARAERADSLGLGRLTHQPDQLRQAMLERANDWSQVRPEWGLAGNAAFVVAPRRRTRHLNLGGRSFLHDYDWRLDTDLSVLTLIMTAPMVVTNWINMQYHASTVDNRRYGSGNKMLHNVVGGHIGVFEGNGGDLRIGLAMQSLHDGHTLRHPPLRLSVFIEAPQRSIDSIIEAHAVVHDLVSNGWIHLLRIEPSTGSVERRTPNGWTT